MQVALSLTSGSTDRVALALSPEYRWGLLACSGLCLGQHDSWQSVRQSVQYSPGPCIVHRWSMTVTVQWAAAQRLGHHACLPKPHPVPCAQVVAAGREANFAPDIDTTSAQSDVMECPHLRDLTCRWLWLARRWTLPWAATQPAQCVCLPATAAPLACGRLMGGSACRAPAPWRPCLIQVGLPDWSGQVESGCTKVPLNLWKKGGQRGVFGARASSL